MRLVRLGQCQGVRRWMSSSAGAPPPAAGFRSASSQQVALEFRRFCEEQVAPVATGVPSAAFAAHIARTQQVPLSIAETVIRDSGCFEFEGTRTLLRQSSRQDVADFVPAMGEIAARIPPSGVGATKMKELIAELAPNFSPSAIGAYTLRDALQMFPGVFVVEPAAKGKWLVKPATRHQPAGSANSSGTNKGANSDSNSAAAVTLLELISKHSTGTSGASLSSILRTVPPTSPLAGMSRQDVIGLLDELEPLVDVSFQVRLRPRLPPRGCYAFVDGDGVSPADVAAIFAACGYTNAQSVKTVVRRGASLPHGANDIVLDERVPAYMGLECQALRTTASAGAILKDVIYICAPHAFQLFRDRVAPSVAFPDAEVFVASVGAIAKVQ